LCKYTDDFKHFGEEISPIHPNCLCEIKYNGIYQVHGIHINMKTELLEQHAQIFYVVFIYMSWHMN